ncbi:MAG: histidine phosphatase family protein [Armatimonadetes bacterium]|nr:histidine phosphatase family protein [Armatimonadota bacterium]
MRVFLVRHGQTEWNVAGRAQGHSDVGLDETGYAQAEKVAGVLEEEGINKIFSSDLQRCIETADPLVNRLGIDLQTYSDLRERTFGELEGSHYTEIRAYFSAESRVQGLEPFEIRPEGGESLKDVWKRLGKIHRTLERESRNVALFTHGGTCGLLLARLIRSQVATASSFRFENGAITELRRRPDGIFQLIRFADTSHLR